MSTLIVCSVISMWHLTGNINIWPPSELLSSNTFHDLMALLALTQTGHGDFPGSPVIFCCPLILLMKLLHVS